MKKSFNIEGLFVPMNVRKMCDSSAAYVLASIEIHSTLRDVRSCVRTKPSSVVVDIRCLSSLADARTSIPTVRMCEELMLVDCSLVYGHRDGNLLPHVNNHYLS